MSAIDSLITLADRYRRLLSLLGALWFTLGCAVYAKFVVVPDVPFLTDDIVLYSGAAYNALWFGFVRPLVVRRRKLLLQPE